MNVFTSYLKVLNYWYFRGILKITITQNAYIYTEKVYLNIDY